MHIKIGRRQMIAGAVAAALFPIMGIKTPAKAAALPSTSLNPFDSDASTLTDMVVSLIEDMETQETVGVLLSVPGFRIDMLDDLEPTAPVGAALTRQLGPGEWSDWRWSADEVRFALRVIKQRNEVLAWAMADYDRRVAAYAGMSA